LWPEEVIRWRKKNWRRKKTHDNVLFITLELPAPQIGLVFSSLVEIQPGGLERRLHPVVMHGQGLDMASNMIYKHMDLAWIVHDLAWSELELDMV
jgi:hypothetical protein